MGFLREEGTTIEALQLTLAYRTLSPVAAGAPAGVVSALPEPSGWRTGAVLDVAWCAVCASVAPRLGYTPPPCASTAAVPKVQAKQRFNAHPALRQGRAWP